MHMNCLHQKRNYLERDKHTNTDLDETNDVQNAHCSMSKV